MGDFLMNINESLVRVFTILVNEKIIVRKIITKDIQLKLKKLPSLDLLVQSRQQKH